MAWFDSSLAAGCFLELLGWTCVLWCIVIGRRTPLRDGRRVILSSQVSRGVHPRCCHWRYEPSPWAGRHVSVPSSGGESTWPQIATMHTNSAYIVCRSWLSHLTLQPCHTNQKEREGIRRGPFLGYACQGGCETRGNRTGSSA